MKEQGLEFNPETATDLRPKTFLFETCGEQFRLVLQIPEYILVKLKGAAMERLQAHMTKYATNVVVEAIRGGYLTSDQGRVSMRIDVAKQLKDHIWNEFSKSQEAAGNAAWQTAPTLQKVHTK
jgi:hypothetical protein